MVVGKGVVFYGDKSPVEDVKARHLNSKIALGVGYTPRDHEGLIPHYY